MEAPNLRTNLVTLNELSQSLKVSPKTIYYWVARREIPYLKAGKHLRFDLEEVIMAFRAKSNSAPCMLDSGLLKTRTAKLFARSLATRKGRLAPNEKE